MKKLLCLLAGLGGSLVACAADPFVTIDGAITDKTPGWTFKASKPNKKGMTYNEFEGYYPDKGGKLYSQRIVLPKAAGTPGYFRLTFEAQAKERAYQGIDFYDAAGVKLPDNYDVVYPGPRRAYDRVFYAMDKAASVEVFFQSKSGCEAWNLKLSPVTVEEAAAYCDRIYAGLKPIQFTAPADSLAKLPRTREALRSGKPWRIVLLGDSIMQDTFHSQFHALVKRAYPKSNLNWIISMRGGTGCWYYYTEENFKKYVADEKPDLLIIGGISNYRKGKTPSGHEAMGIVARMAKERLGCEILFMTGALAVDLRPYDKDAVDRPLPVEDWYATERSKVPSGCTNLPELRKVADALDAPVWDMFNPSYAWLYATGLPHEFYSRDFVHSGEIGKQIIGRIATAYFCTP